MDELEVVRTSISFDHPGAMYVDSFHNHFWDGKIKFYDKFNNTFNYGMLHYVLKALNKKKLQYELIGFEDQDVSWIKFSELFLPEERDYQRNAVIEFFKKGCGIIKVPTRGGKTFISAEIIRLMKIKHENSKILFVTDSSDAFKQNINDISKVLNIDPDQIGRIKESTLDIKQVNVAMIQTIQSKLKRNNKIIQEFLKKLNFLVIDEVQEFSSKERIKFIRKCKNIDNLLAISGTPYKKDDLIANLNIENITGGIVYEIEEQKLVDRKVLSESKILLFNIEHQPFENNYGYQELTEKLIIENKNRNDVILSLIETTKSLGLKTLILFSSKKHGYSIEKMSGVKFLCGDNNDDERLIEKEKFLKGIGQSLLVSTIWKKAITLPAVEIMMNASGGKEESMIIQIRGRALGVTEDKKKSLHIDFIDNYDDYFNEHSLERIKAYEQKVGMKNIDVLDVHDANFVQDLKQYLIDWFEK